LSRKLQNAPAAFPLKTIFPPAAVANDLSHFGGCGTRPSVLTHQDGLKHPRHLAKLQRNLADSLNAQGSLAKIVNSRKIRSFIL